MKLSAFIFTVSLPALAVSVACPFEELHRAGVLSSDDAAKFEAVKRDPRAAEVLLKLHRREAEPGPAPASQSGGLIGPVVNGILDLPLGGGLCKSNQVFAWDVTEPFDSKRCSPTLDRNLGGTRYTHSPATRTYPNTWRRS